MAAAQAGRRFGEGARQLVPGAGESRARLSHTSTSARKSPADRGSGPAGGSPREGAASTDDITITVSNFGDLAAVSIGKPGSYDEEEEQELFHRDDRHRIEDELHALGYHAISEHILWNTYDGVSDLGSHHPPEHPPSWWIRFFDHL